MKPIRLLPVVIFAALALLVFKGIGLVTNGGYVLTGTVVAAAQEESSSSPGGASDNSAVTPADATLQDSNPSLLDTAPTLATKVDAPPDGAPSGEPAADPSSSAVAHAAAPQACVTDPSAVAPSDGSSLPCIPPEEQKPPINANGDAVPTAMDPTGRMVPLDAAEGVDNSQDALLQRLSARRDALDKREADLNMREAVVSAAEKKLDEKTKELADLQAQVSALVDQKQAAEDANFKAIVAMYETMKPKDAAKIFDTLDLSVLIKVSQAMNPRKMSPILAAMSPKPAEALTTAFAVNNNPMPPANAGASENLAQLPQIVGH